MSALSCPDCGRFVPEQGGLHDCPGPAVCGDPNCLHDSIQHVVERTKSGKVTRYGECHSAFDGTGQPRPCSCQRFRRGGLRTGGPRP